MSPISRRTLVLGGLAVAGAGALPAGQAATAQSSVITATAAVPYPFQLGIASGEPDANSVVLWTRLAPSPLNADGQGGMANADVAVELRNSSDGEASAAVCDCLAARVPTIVSSVGWLGELPDPAVMRVPRGCAPGVLAGAILRVLDEPELRERIRASQDDYAAANSYERIAERYAEILGL